MFPLFKPKYNLKTWIIYELTLLRKKLIKFSNFAGSVYNFNNNGTETEKNDIQTTY